jgi:hypothetical protein
MPRKKKIKVKIGDIFKIKLAEDTYGYGQVVSEGKTSDCLIAFDLHSYECPSLDEITSKDIIFFIQTVNSRLEDGLWDIIGNATVPEISFPKYKEETEHGFKLINYLGETINLNPTQNELEGAIRLKSRSPVTLENALKAKYITGKWDPYYNDLIYVKD